MESWYLFDSDTHKAGGRNDTARYGKTSFGSNVTVGIVTSQCILTLQCSSLEVACRFFFFLWEKGRFIFVGICSWTAPVPGWNIDCCVFQQLIKDMVSVGESTNWLTRRSLYSKYRALKCHIEWLQHESDEFKKIQEHVNASETR